MPGPYGLVSSLSQGVGETVRAQWECPNWVVDDQNEVVLCLAGKDHEGEHKYRLTDEEHRQLAEKMAVSALVQGLRDTEWMDEALCIGQHPLFDYEGTSATRGTRDMVQVHNEKTIKYLCYRCPVRRECLTYGLHDENGAWGGTLPWDRQKHKEKENAVDVLLGMMDEQVAGFFAQDEEAIRKKRSYRHSV
jgi:hypothetical protein